jgi:ribose transport system ATP-binding protein
MNRVEMLGISKSFAGLKALNGVNFSAAPGEVHALIGENGAGKSTLIKILAGAYAKDAGKILLDGKTVDINGPQAGIKNGISVIYQEFALASHMTVAENIYIDKLSDGGGIVNWKRIRRDARELLDRLGFGDINVMKSVSELTIAYQQIVEIAKALTREARVLVLDEPTAVLTSREVERLFVILEELKTRGVCIIYVSHRLEEIFRVSDRITILKDGENVGAVNTGEIDQNHLVEMMIGRKMEEYFPRRDSVIGDEVFRIEDINREQIVRNVSFGVRRGEVFGISGLVGSGRTETMRAVFGADRADTGKVFLFGKETKIKNPKAAVKLGIGMLPEDRKKHGVILNMSVKENGTMTIIDRFRGLLGFIKNEEESGLVKELTDKLSVKTSSINGRVSSLSGGNQQKVALMKWIASDARVLILDEPTRGVDVGAKVDIYKVINQLAGEGVAVIMISSEMNEIIGMCDRTAVMRQGEIVGFLEKDDISEINIIRLAMGVQ